jgi:hypothetical protein
MSIFLGSGGELKELRDMEGARRGGRDDLDVVAITTARLPFFAM